MHDVRDLGGRLFWLMISVVMGFASMFALVCGISAVIEHCGHDSRRSINGFDLPSIFAGSVALILAWYVLLQALDRYLGRRRDRVVLARAWIPTTRKPDRVPRATI
jgi:hypothetical protein